MTVTHTPPQGPAGTPSADARGTKPGRVIGLFLAAAFTLSWAWAWPLALSGALVKHGDGWPTHFPALLSPAIAALLVTAGLRGRTGIKRLIAGMVRWRFPLRWWLIAVSPLAFLAIALPVQAMSGERPAASAFGRYTGLPAVGILGVAALAIALNGFGEETGWRGYAVPVLLPRFGSLGTALVIAPIWAVWHLPYFFLLDTYRSFNAFTVIGFLIGLMCGSIVLTWLYLGTGGSILAVAVWHGLYNMATATDGSTSLVAGIVSGLVIAMAVAVAPRLRRMPRYGDNGAAHGSGASA